jgi:hypothetical protein
MKILGWNCRGICNTSTVRALRALVKGHRPKIIFLCETKASESRLVKIAGSLGFSEHLIVAAQGRSGGVCLFWSTDFLVDVLEFNAITIAISIRDNVRSWTLVGFYGPPYQQKHYKAWTNLLALLESIVGPWMCFRDFNMVFEAKEKVVGRIGSASGTNYLRNLMFELGAVDLGFSGNRFTWHNKRWGNGCIRERLDRGITNILWRSEFPRANVLHLGAVNSDHCPLLIDTNPADVRCPRPFRFEAMWTGDPRCFDVIFEAWKRNFEGIDSFILFKKQFFLALDLRKWNKAVFGHVQTRIDEFTRSIELIQREEPTEENINEEAHLLDGLNTWLGRNETLWRQKSRETWLKEGDRNSRFFHISSVVRRRRNTIDAIRGDDGEWIVKVSDIKEFVVDKFQDLFAVEDISCPAELENLIPSMVTEDDNLLLCQIPSPREIKNIVFGMQSLKSPGPDGLPPLFYKKYWEVVGISVIKAVRDFFISGKMLKEVNYSFIVLIPKIINPSTINHYRPISLCNTIYKVISKLLVDRLRAIIPNLVSPTQLAFIPGRWIAENQLIVQEILHSFKKRKVKGGFVAVKLDLQKAYDRVHWGFLKIVLNQFGFYPKFVGWIMECISSVSFSILVNGGITKKLRPSRGLRQSDPLSPYLFILDQEVLSRLIDREFFQGSISGVKMTVNGPAFTHVMYADDIMLFAKANSREVQILDNCLVTYCEWSGQRINRNKSGFICSKLVARDRKRDIKLLLDMKMVQSNVNYLGSPLFHSSSRIKDFKFLQDKLEARLLGWRSKTLSWAGRATLIKSVAMALPMYTFSSSDVPVSVCVKMDASIRRFWWNPESESGRFLAWKSWDDLCVPKALGGLGFRCAKKFNAILMAKLTWMLVSRRDSPCMVALRSKYKVKEGWINNEPLKSSSITWKAIERLKPLIRKGACFIIEDGKKVDCWKDPWIPWIPSFIPSPKDASVIINPFMVENLINGETNTWKVGLLMDMFDQESVVAITKIILPVVPRQDKLTWVADPKGLFSVKSAMGLIQRDVWPAAPDPI